MNGAPGRQPSAIAKPVPRRHGKTGFVRVGCDMDPKLRQRLIDLAWERRTSLSDQIRIACEKHVAEVAP